MTLSLTSPLPLTPPAAEFLRSSPPPRGALWIGLDEAMRRSGLSKGQLRRLCLEQWQSAGLAEQRTPPEGGKRTWFISETVDPRIARVKSPSQLSDEFDLSPFTDVQRRELLAKKRIIENYTAARAGGMKLGFTEAQITAQFLLRLEAEEDRKLSRATLFNWSGAYRRDGMAGLVDPRWRQSTSANQQSDPFFSFLKQIYLTPRRLNIAKCHLLAEQKAVESGWPIHSYAACKRYLNNLPRQLIIKARQGESAFVAKCEPSIERDYSQLASNDIWSGDHHRFDVMIRHGNYTDGRPKFLRPWITGWEDMRSRKIVGWTIFAHDPNTDTILEAFISGCRSHGLPKKVQTDNGDDFGSRALNGTTKTERRASEDAPFISDERAIGAFNILGIGVDRVQPYHGQSKPIERLFRTICGRFSQLWETYCGNSPENRPENLYRAKGKPGQLDLGKAPTLEEFTQAFAEWLEADYHGRMHLGDSMNGQTPAAIFDQCLASKRVMDDSTLLFACMPRTKPVKVGRHGVTYHGLHFGAFDSQIQKLYGQRVILAVDNNDLSRILVLDLEGRLICSAKANVKIGFDAASEDLRAAMAEKRKLRKTLREYTDRRPRMSEDLHLLTQRAAARRKSVEANPAPASPPPSISPVRTSIEDRPEHIREALESPMRIAAGAESMSAFVFSSQPDAEPDGDSAFIYHGATRREEDRL